MSCPALSLSTFWIRLLNSSCLPRRNTGMLPSVKYHSLQSLAFFRHVTTETWRIYPSVLYVYSDLPQNVPGNHLFILQQQLHNTKRRHKDKRIRLFVFCYWFGFTESCEIPGEQIQPISDCSKTHKQKTSGWTIYRSSMERPEMSRVHTHIHWSNDYILLPPCL